MRDNGKGPRTERRGIGDDGEQKAERVIRAESEFKMRTRKQDAVHAGNERQIEYKQWRESERAGDERRGEWAGRGSVKIDTKKQPPNRTLRVMAVERQKRIGMKRKERNGGADVACGTDAAVKLKPRN